MSSDIVQGNDREQAIRTSALTDDSSPITDETRRSIIGLSQNFYAKLPTNETQRRTETVRAAETLCSESKSIDPTVFDVSGEFDRQSYRLYHATNTINEHFNDEISTRKLQSSMSAAGSLSKYTPLVGSYNRMYEASCAVDPADEESIERFYVASAAFGVEAALIQQQVFFKSSFAATRYTTNKLSLMKVRTVTGDKGYGMLMSEIHWAYRGSQATATSYVFTKSTELGFNASELDRTSIREVSAERYETSREVANHSLKTGRETVGNTTEIMEDCAAATKNDDSESLWDRANEKISDLSEGLESGLQSVAEVEPKDIPDHVNKSIDQPQEFANCLEKQLDE